MSEPNEPDEREAAPEVDSSAYPPDAEPLVTEELTEDDLKGADIHRDDLSGDEPAEDAADSEDAT